MESNNNKPNGKTVRVGVLGGIGPEATGEFYVKLIDKLQKSGKIKSNSDFPQIIVNSIPAPELIYDDLSDSDLVPYINGLKELDNAGVDFIVMVCNTIHLFIKKLQDEIETPILDLRKVMEDELSFGDNAAKIIAVIGTPLTIRKGLYSFSNVKSLIPDDDEIDGLTNAIFRFNKGIEKSKQVDFVISLCNKYIEQGAKRVVLGCTEFAVMLKDTDIPVINTIDVLVSATVKECFEK